MQLRPHQELAIQMLRDSLAAGNKRPLLAAPCSFGKTITAASMLKNAADRGKRGIFICDRVKLITQSIEQFDKHGIDYGVLQGRHFLEDPTKSVQIASIQTLARRRTIPDFDFAIVDEAHTHYDYTTKMMEAFNNVPFIGLSATPFSKGLGKHYNDLIVPITAEELLDQGYLCPVVYYGGTEANTKGIKMKALPTGGSDFNPDALAESVENDTKLTGDIVSNWVKQAYGRQTIAFSPSIKHSKYLVEKFQEIGISAAHIDGYMDQELRLELFKAHDAGEIMILSCSRLLNTGYDAPKVSCLIDCFPTKSHIAYVQRAGRIMRTHPGKESAIYLDHSGNVSRFGFAETIVPDTLDDGEKRYNEERQVKKKDKKPVNCPECSRKMTGIKCACGFQFSTTKELETDGSDLVKLSKKANKAYSSQRKAEWLAELKYYAKTRGYKEGWANHKYKAKFGVWPNKVSQTRVDGMSDEVLNFIKSQNIANQYRRMKSAA